MEELTTNVFLHEENEIIDPAEIGKVFNTFFTSLSSNSLSSESDNYLDKVFSKLKRENKNQLKTKTFSFCHTNSDIVENLIINLNSTMVLVFIGNTV